ncbi:MAG: S1 family peptidase [Acidimicrobiales bacterium]
MADDDMSPEEDPLQDQMDAAALLARSVAGEDDQQFVLVFHSLVNVIDRFRSQRDAREIESARSVLALTAEPMTTQGRRGLAMAPTATGPLSDSIYADPVYLQNAMAMIPDVQRIVGGIPTRRFPDCVAVGAINGWCCTGTLVAPNVVVTAAHCILGMCSNRIFVGQDVKRPAAGTVVRVKQAVTHPDYAPPRSATHDIAVLILTRDADGVPRAMAEPGHLQAAVSVRLAGYGNTDVHSSGGYGRRRVVDVPLAGEDVNYGADFASEFVAGAPFLDRDSCNGDSGGPAYVQSGTEWRLAGVTSRATASSVRPCGDGGVYTRVASYTDWIRSVPGGHWTV